MRRKIVYTYPVKGEVNKKPEPRRFPHEGIRAGGVTGEGIRHGASHTKGFLREGEERVRAGENLQKVEMYQKGYLMPKPIKKTGSFRLRFS